MKKKVPTKIKNVNNPTSTGGYSWYYKLSRYRGVKLLSGTFESVKEAKDSVIWNEAKKEFANLSYAYKTGIVPKCYGIDIFSVGPYYQVGIIMQHLGETRLVDLSLLPEDSQDILESVNEKLKKYRIIHEDLHDENIMYHNNKYWAIDFQYIYIRK